MFVHVFGHVFIQTFFYAFVHAFIQAFFQAFVHVFVHAFDDAFVQENGDCLNGESATKDLKQGDIDIKALQQKRAQAELARSFKTCASKIPELRNFFNRKNLLLFHFSLLNLEITVLIIIRHD